MCVLFQFPQVLLLLVFCITYGLCSGCEVVSHFVFNLCFPNDWQCWVSCMYQYLLAICMSALENCSDSLSIFNWISNCKSFKSSLYILDTSHLQDRWFANISSCSVIVFSLYWWRRLQHKSFWGSPVYQLFSFDLTYAFGVVFTKIYFKKFFLLELMLNIILISGVQHSG